MDPTESPIVEAVAGLVVAEQAQAVEHAVHIDTVLENANARIDEAQKTAEQIAAAAMESERGQRIEHVEEKIWHGEQEVQELRHQMQEIKDQVSEVMQALSSLTTLQVASTMQASSSLIPPISETSLETAVSETMEILPGNLENVVEENPIPQVPVPQKRKRWI